MKTIFMILENQDELQDKDLYSTDPNREAAPSMSADTDDDMDDEDEEDDEDDDMDDDDADDDSVGYDILPSNDAGITADDNAATGELHQREGD